MTTALSIITDAGNELGLPVASITSATGDTLGVQSLALLNALGKELRRVHDWQILEKTAIFTGDGVSSTFVTPADFYRQINQTMWSSNSYPVLGPQSPQAWGWLLYGLAGSTGTYQYRILGDKYVVNPVPVAGEMLHLSYISKNWVIDQDSSATYKDAVTKSLDVPLYDERLLIAGLKLRLWAQKGFETTLLQQEYDAILRTNKSQAQGAPELCLTAGRGTYLITEDNVPNSGFGV